MGRTGLGFWSNIEGRQGLRLASRPLPYKAYRASSSPLLPLCASSFLSSSVTRNLSSSRSPGFIQCGHLALLW
jgi:hypothetical protein